MGGAEAAPAWCPALPGVAAGRGKLPGVAEGTRAGPPAEAGVLLEPLRRMPSFLAGCADPPAVAGVMLPVPADAGVPATAAGRGVANPPAAGGADLGALAGVPAAAAGVPADAGGLLLCPLSANLRGPVPGADAGVACTAACCGVDAAGVAWPLLLAPLSMILGPPGVPVEGRGAAGRDAPLRVKPPGRGTDPEGLGRAFAAADAMAPVLCCEGALARCSPLPEDATPLLGCCAACCEPVFLMVSLNRAPPELMAAICCPELKQRS